MKLRDVVIFSGARFEVPEGIQRIDHRATHGWQLRYGGTKLFSDFTPDGSGAARSLGKATRELLARIAKLYCKNERAVVRFQVEGQALPVLLVPVAAILVASIRFTFTDVRLHLKYAGPNRIECDATLKRGDEMGWFEHGSTIIVIAPRGYELAPGITAGNPIQMGNALMRAAKPRPCH